MAVYKITPTKANLMKVESMLKLMRSSYELLDKKRIVLLRAALEQQRKREELEARFFAIQKKMNAAFSHATVAIGRYHLNEIALGMPVDERLEAHYRSYMGVEVTEFSLRDDAYDANYDTVHLTLDYATDALLQFKATLLELASVTDAAERLQREMVKTQKRANALDKVQIPKYEALQRFISQSLEEKERDEFFRLKLLKKKKTRKKAASS
ncbi:MAG: V-type ATP synthase subunit D [Peptoniphilaceae bacterium]|nr:V-type ATP synthase subunit D [Peptoniphilaceae bacterium]MDY6085139.1 V-type ATP synthase subunit D [Peptoniphilaceae bacterium]